MSASPPDPIFTLRPYSGEVTSVQYVKLSQSEAAVASGSSSGSIHLWSLQSKRSLWVKNVVSSIMHLDVCNISGTVRLICQKRDDSVEVWDHINEKKVASFVVNNSGFCKLSTFHNDSKKHSCIAVACQDSKKIHIYDLTGIHVESYSTRQSVHKGMCMCVKSLYSDSTGSCYILGGFEDGSVVIWDERNPRAELHTCQLFTEPVLCMAVDDTMRGVAGTVGSSVQSFNVSHEKGVLEKKFMVHVKNPGISDIAIRQDRRIFATGGWDGRIRVFTWSKGKPLAILNYHSCTVNSICFADDCSDENLLMCGSKDEVVSIWKLY